MKKTSFLVVFIFMVLLMSNTTNAQFFPYDYEVYELENGLTSHLIPVEGSGLVAYYSIVRTGSRDEWEPGHTGFAHFFEHMMFRGTENYPGPVYDSLITSIGADANAYTTDDLTAYHLVVPTQKLETVVKLESDRFQNLSYSESDFKTEAGAVYGEYRKGRVNPWWILQEEMYNLAFNVHTYEHTTIGFEEDIKNMPNMFAYSKSFFKRYYRPENIVLQVAGEFDVAQTKELINKYYDDWKPGYKPPQIKPEPPQKQERSKTVQYSGKTLPIFALGYKGPAFNPSDRMVAASFLLGDLAFGENSELYKKLVLKEQKVEFISGDFSFNRDPNLLIVYSMIKNEADIQYVKEEIEKTIESFKSQAVSQDELKNIKNRIKYGFLMRLNTPDNIASRVARFVAMTGELESVDKFYQTMETITPDDIRAAANQFLQISRRTVITLKGEK